MVFLLLLLRLAGIKTTVTMHSTWMLEQVRERISKYKILGKISVLAKSIFLLYMKVLNRSVTSVQLSTVRLDSLLRKRFLREYHFSEEKTLEIPHPCETIAGIIDRKTALERIGLQAKKVVLVFGFIRRGKGLETAIESMKTVSMKINNAILLIAGRPLDSDGKRYLTELKNQSEEKGLESVVQFHDSFIPESMLSVYMSAASTILIPYQDSVGVSGPAHNNAGYGVPIVASDAGYHMRETLGGNIVLFPSGNAEALASRLIKILTDQTYANIVGEAIQSFAKRHTWQLAINMAIENYRKTLFHLK